MYERVTIMKIIKIVCSLAVFCCLCMTGCGKGSENTTDAAIEKNTTESITSINDTETSAPNFEISVSGKTLSFPFKYEDLDKMIDLSDCQNVYFEESDFTVCTVYNGMSRICTLFVTGDVSEHTSETLVTLIEIDEPEKGIFTLNGLKNDTLEDFKSEFGESETESDSLYEHTWGNIILSVFFDHETGEASSIELLDTDYPHSL